MKRHLKIYIAFIKQNIKSIVEYRLDFLIGFFSTFLRQGSGILFVWMIFLNINDMKGWNFYEITFIYGMLSVSKSLFGLLYGGLWDFGNYVKQGEFDRVLLRPIPPLFYIMSNNINQSDIGELAIGIIILVTSIFKTRIDFGITEVIMLLIFIIGGTLIFSAIMLIAATLSFWMTDSKPIMLSFYSFSDFALYPLTIFNKFVAIALTWLIPYAFVSYYPANFFLDKGYKSISILSPFVALLLWFIALRFWNFGIKRYGSTGS